MDAGADNDQLTVEPGSPYAVSKYAAERFCRMLHRGRGWPIVLLRPFNAYGPAQSPDRVIPEVIGDAGVDPTGTTAFEKAISVLAFAEGNGSIRA